MPGRVFTAAERDRVRDRLIKKARRDRRVVAGALLGSSAVGAGDRWSDVDLTFGLAEGVEMKEVLDDWTNDLGREFGAAHLFDVSDRSTVYRVFLLPGNLQVDVSFTPGFVAQYGPRFKLQFGNAVRQDYPPPVSAREIFGIGVHHAVRARYCMERNRRWQAEYWINGILEQALSLACHRRGLEASHARSFDLLPEEVLALADKARMHSLARTELLRALTNSIELLLQEAEEVRDFAAQLERQLRDLVSIEWPES